MGNYTSIKSMLASYSPVTNSYKCLKKSKIIIFLTGNTYLASGNIKLNDKILFEYSGTDSYKFMKYLDVEPDDIVTFTYNGGQSSNAFLYTCMIHEDGAF